MATMAISGQQMDRMAARHTRTRRHASIAERNRELYERQLARRRGPTPEMFFPKHIDNSRIVKADDPVRRREIRRFTFAMIAFFALTMTYVLQHFYAIEVGYNVEAQKAQVEQLREKNRQLELMDAQLSDPNRIDRMAKQLGLDVPLPGQVVQTDGPVGAEPVLAQAHVPATVLQAN